MKLRPKKIVVVEGNKSFISWLIKRKLCSECLHAFLKEERRNNEIKRQADAKKEAEINKVN